MRLHSLAFAAMVLTSTSACSAPVATAGGAESDFTEATTVATYGEDGFSPVVDGLLSAHLVQPDGKMVLAGYLRDGFANAVVVARFTTNGELDPTFGSGGVFRRSPAYGVVDHVALAPAPDGSVFVTLSGTPPPPAVPLWDSTIAVLRLGGDGQPQRAFSTSPPPAESPWTFTATRVTSRVRAATVGADGSLYVVHGGRYPSVVRFASDGSKDEAFAANVAAVDQRVHWYENMEYRGIVLLPDGRFVVGGSSTATDGRPVSGPKFMRFLPDGSLDPTFGARGVAFFNRRLTHSFFDVEAFDVLPTGEIIAVGKSHRYPGHDSTAFVLRLRPDGVLDPSFGDGGVTERNLTVDRPISPASDLVRFQDGFFGLGIDSAGRILAAGRTDGLPAVARLLPTGALDTTWGEDGVVVVGGLREPEQQRDGPAATGVVLRPDGSVLLPIGGPDVFSTWGGNGRMAVVAVRR